MNSKLSRGIVFGAIILGLVWFTRPHDWWQNVVAVPVILAAPAVILGVLRPLTRRGAGKANVDAFLLNVRLNVPELLDVPDSDLLEHGRKVCRIYEIEGDEGIKEVLRGSYAEKGDRWGEANTYIAVAARLHLCPGTGGRAPVEAVAAPVLEDWSHQPGEPLSAPPVRAS